VMAASNRELRAHLNQIMEEEVHLGDLTTDESRDMIALLTAARQRMSAIEAGKVVRLRLVHSAAVIS
jgi:polyhydroxyalkanoate synthesis regulator phasin